MTSLQSSSAYLLFYCRRDEGKVVQPALSRTLSQTFAEEVCVWWVGVGEVGERERDEVIKYYNVIILR